MRRKRARRAWNPDPGILTVVQVLLLLQGGFLVLSTIEVVFLGLATGTVPLLAPAILLTGASAVFVLGLVAALGRRFYVARRLVLVGEVAVLLVAALDLGLTIFLAKAPLDLVPLLTRVALPVAVIALLRRIRTRAPVESRELPVAMAAAA